MKIQSHSRIVSHRLAIRGVVHLKHEGRVCGQKCACAVRKFICHRTRNIATQSAPAGSLKTAVFTHRAKRSNNMVQRLAITRNNFYRADPNVFFKRVFNVLVLIRHRSGSRHSVRRDFYNGIRLTKRPFGPFLFGCFKRICAFTARRSGFNPVHQLLSLSDRQ